MSDFNRRCVAWALTKIGKPYIWAASGTSMWTPSGMVKTFDRADVSEAYDCVGLVKSAVFACGGPDLRAKWNAQSVFDFLQPPGPDEEFTLRLYGSSGAIQHIAFDIGSGLRLEAAGGDHTTTNLARSLSRPAAFVRVGFELRNDFIAFRSLAAMEKVNASIPPRR